MFEMYRCDVCGKEQPKEMAVMTLWDGKAQRQYHLCNKCSTEVLNWIDRRLRDNQ